MPRRAASGGAAPDPFALGGWQDGDAVLLAAETDLRRLLIERNAMADKNSEFDRMWDEISRLQELINNTAPATVIGCAVKLRYLANPDLGMATGCRDDDVVSIRQILRVIELQAALARQSMRASARWG